MNEDKQISKNDWEIRGARANQQEEVFRQLNQDLNNLDTKEKIVTYHENLVYSIIKSFVLERDIYNQYESTLYYNPELNSNKYVKKVDSCIPIKVNMKKLLLSEKYMNQYIFTKVKNMSEILTEESGKYIYVVQRDDGMVAVVGFSSFEFDKNKNDGGDSGDLFKQLNLSKLAGTERIILRSRFGNDIENMLLNYYKVAWIIPIPKIKITNITEYRKRVNASFNIHDNFKFEMNKLIEEETHIEVLEEILYDLKSKQLETELGEYIIENKIPILNYYSHLFN